VSIGIALGGGVRPARR